MTLTAEQTQRGMLSGLIKKIKTLTDIELVCAVAREHMREEAYQIWLSTTLWPMVSAMMWRK